MFLIILANGLLFVAVSGFEINEAVIDRAKELVAAFETSMEPNRDAMDVFCVEYNLWILNMLFVCLALRRRGTIVYLLYRTVKSKSSVFWIKDFLLVYSHSTNGSLPVYALAENGNFYRTL